MSSTCSHNWRRDLLVGGLASLLTAVAVVPLVAASQRSAWQEVATARREAVGVIYHTLRGLTHT